MRYGRNLLRSVLASNGNWNPIAQVDFCGYYYISRLHLVFLFPLAFELEVRQGLIINLYKMML